MTNFYYYLKEVRRKNPNYDSLQRLQLLKWVQEALGIFFYFFSFEACIWVGKPATLSRIVNLKFTQGKLILKVIEGRRMAIS